MNRIHKNKQTKKQQPHNNNNNKQHNLSNRIENKLQALAESKQIQQHNPI